MKKIKLPLEMGNGVVVRTLEELKANWDFKKIITYYLDGRLVNWLKDRYYDELAQQVENLNCDDAEFQKQLSAVFGMQVGTITDVDIDYLVDNHDRCALLRQYTSDEKIIENVDFVAFNQEELKSLITKKTEVIYLCGDKFKIRLDDEVKKYIGIGSVTVIMEEVEREFFKKYLNKKDEVIKFENIELDAETVEGMDEVGVIYELGKGVSKNIEKAFAFYNKAADSGSVWGKFHLGRCFHLGTGGKQDYNKAFALFSEAANQDHAGSQGYLAIYYYYGYGVEEDKNKAFDWMFKAANAGNVVAKRILGVYFLDGTGCVKDEEKAVVYLEEAAFKGDFWGQYQMGVCYARGIGREKNFAKSLNWYKKAVETDVKVFMINSFNNLNEENQDWDLWKKRLLKIIDAVIEMFENRLFQATVDSENARTFSLGAINDKLLDNMLKSYGTKCGVIKNQVWFLNNDTMISASGSIGFAMDLFGLVTSRKERILFNQINDIWLDNDGRKIYVAYKDGKKQEIYDLDCICNYYKDLKTNDERRRRTRSELNQMFKILSVALKD